MKRLALSLLLGLLASPVMASSWVNWDNGGNMEDRVREIERIRVQGLKFHIEGMCVSACTMYLSLPDVCVAPQSVLGFHSAAAVSEKGAEKSELANVLLMSYYPPRIKKWVTDHHALDSLEKMVPMSAEEAWALGVAHCDVS